MTVVDAFTCVGWVKTVPLLSWCSSERSTEPEIHPLPLLLAGCWWCPLPSLSHGGASHTSIECRVTQHPHPEAWVMLEFPSTAATTGWTQPVVSISNGENKRKVNITRLLKPCHVPESRTCFLKRVSASAPLKAELKLLEGGTCVIWSRGWVEMDPLLALASCGTAQPASCQLRGSTHCLSVGCCPVPSSSYWQTISLSNQYRVLITWWFINPDAISLQAVVSLQEEMVYNNDYVLIDWGLVEGEFLSPYILCTVKNIIYFLQKSISPPEYVPQGQMRKWSCNPLLLLPLFHSWDLILFLGLFLFFWGGGDKLEPYLEEPTKTTVYRLKSTAFILLGSWATILLQIFSTA